MAAGAKFSLLLKITGLQKLELDLRNQFQMEMILEAFAKMTVASFVPVIHTNHLVLVDGVGGDDSGKVAVNEIFEIASNLSKTGALVLLIKDIEKGVAGNSEVLKSKFGSLPQNVVVIGSHIQPDSRKEKTQPGSLLFTKFGGNQTALLDLAFPDNFTRLHDRSKETPKVMKQLNRLFPNKVTIQLPQDETLLSDWKQHLDRDIETMKAQSNVVSIRL
ncbi:katanin p60 ATPase-containing subunit, partial [Trifolium medium]|nr:katanin p60 ATPase-containing subunit [Trifolium medium]